MTVHGSGRPRLAIAALAVLLTGCWVTETEVISPRDSRKLAGRRFSMLDDARKTVVYAWDDRRAGYLDAESNGLMRFARLKDDVYIAQYQPLKLDDANRQLVSADRRVFAVVLVRLAPPRLVAQSASCREREQAPVPVWLARAYGVELDERRGSVTSGTREAILGFLTATIDCQPTTLEPGEMTAETIDRGGPELAALGTTYDRGRYVPYFQQKCNAGDLAICYKLAQTLRSGDGVPADARRAAPIFERVCDSSRRLVEACVDLALMYEHGEGVPKDPARATALLEKACAGGEMYACDLLKQRGSSTSPSG